MGKNGEYFMGCLDIRLEEEKQKKNYKNVILKYFLICSTVSRLSKIFEHLTGFKEQWKKYELLFPMIEVLKIGHEQKKSWQHRSSLSVSAP